MKVLIHLSHHSSSQFDGWSGAPGEAVWVQDLVAHIMPKLVALGIQPVTVDGDLGSTLNPSGDHPAFHQDYDAFIAPHYEANVHNEGGSFWGRATASLTGAKDDALGKLFWSKYSALPGKPQDRFQWSNPNVTDYYGFRLTTAQTPGILVEHGVGAPGAPDYQWLRDNVDAIAGVWASTLAEFGGVASVPQPQPGPTPIGVPVLGESTLRFRKLVEKIYATNPDAPLAAIDAYEAFADKGLRAEIMLAQAIHETDYFRFTKIAKREWHNPAGLGVTGAPDVGNRFLTWELGIRAHMGHNFAYFLPVGSAHINGFCDIDQRHFEHRGYVNDVVGWNGHWAVPGTTYGQSVAALL